MTYNRIFILNLIQNKVEENINLEFKRASSLQNSDHHKKEISKDVAAFANSNGGLIIYGIEEKEHVPFRTDFVDASIITKEWLEDVISSNIHPKIDGLIIHTIKFENEIKNSIYIVEVPSGKNSPFMSNDNKFYRRYNFKSVPMEEYEIRNLYFKPFFSELKLIVNNFRFTNQFVQNSKIQSGSFLFDILVQNTGKKVERFYKAEIIVNKYITVGIGANQYLNRVDSSNQYFSYIAKSPIFPSEELRLLYIDLELNINNYHYFEDNPIKIILYYESGTQIYELSTSIINYEKPKLLNF